MCLTVKQSATLSLMDQLREAGGRGLPFWKSVKPHLNEGTMKLLSPIRRDFEWEAGLIKASDVDGPVVKMVSGGLLDHHLNGDKEIVEGGALHVFRQEAGGRYWGVQLKVWGRYEDFVAANDYEACFTALWIDYEDIEGSRNAGKRQALEEEMRRVMHLRYKNKQRLYKALSNKVHGTKFKV